MRRRPSVVRICYATLFAASISLAATTKPATTKPTTKPAAGAAASRRKGATPPGLSAAVQALGAEFDAWVKSRSDAAIRAKSDYFEKRLPDDTTADDVYIVLARTMNGAPPRVAYIKWELLSGLPTTIDVVDMPKLFAAYSAAPAPFTAFSADASTRRQLDSALVGRKEDDQNDLEAGFAKLAKPTSDANLPILQYRSALLNRLPVSAETLFARIDDMTVRAATGVIAGGDTAAFDSALQAWLATGGDAPTIDRLRTAVRKLGTVKIPDTYTGTLQTSATSKGLTWQKSPNTFSATRITEWQTALTNAANTAGSGGNFKFKS